MNFNSRCMVPSVILGYIFLYLLPLLLQRPCFSHAYHLIYLNVFPEILILIFYPMFIPESYSYICFSVAIIAFLFPLIDFFDLLYFCFEISALLLSSAWKCPLGLCFYYLLPFLIPSKLFICYPNSFVSHPNFFPPLSSLALFLKIL